MISFSFVDERIPLKCLADNEKEQEIQIGFPTDVKHVAHIGWDGPSVNSPSWVIIHTMYYCGRFYFNFLIHYK